MIANRQVLTVTNQHATTEELFEVVFSTRSVPRGYITRTSVEQWSVVRKTAGSESVERRLDRAENAGAGWSPA
jgi:hypothetical protein